MTIVVTSEGTGLGDLFLDDSGGAIVFTFAHPAYTSTHKLRVIPFGNSGSGIFNSPPSATTANLSQEADNLVNLIAGCYAADTTITAIAVQQVTNANDGVNPYPYTFTGTVSLAGTAGGVSQVTYEVHDMVGFSQDGDRWRFQLPGVSSAVTPGLGRVNLTSVTGALNALYKYLTGQTNGPVTAAKTNVVTHSGIPLGTNMDLVISTNKRLRRHFKVA